MRMDQSFSGTRVDAIFSISLTSSFSEYTLIGSIGFSVTSFSAAQNEQRMWIQWYNGARSMILQKRKKSHHPYASKNKWARSPQKLSMEDPMFSRNSISNKSISSRGQQFSKCFIFKMNCNMGCSIKETLEKNSIFWNTKRNKSNQTMHRKMKYH